MKKLLFFSIMMLSAKLASAQVTETRVLVDTINVPSLYMEVDMPEDNIKEAIENYFAAIKVEKEKAKGFIFKKPLAFLIFKRASVDTIMGGELLNYYFKVEARKQKGSEVTTIYLAATKGYNAFISAETESRTWKNLKVFAEYLRRNYFEPDRVNRNIFAITKDYNKDSLKLKDLQLQVEKLKFSMTDKYNQLNTLQSQLYKLKTGSAPKQ